MQASSRSAYIIAFFALVKLLIPFLFIHPDFELHRDEYLYLADADHPAWGYVEMPPLLAFLGYISKLLGGTLSTVRLWGGLSGALTVLVVGRIVLQLRGNSTAVFFACLGFLCAGFLRMNILFQPNFLDVFFWTLSSYYIICWIDTDQKKYLYFLGICFGLGILGKYSTAFYIIGFLTAVLLTRKRKWLGNKHFYFAMIVGLLICLPNLVWQYTHHFPVMHHMELLNRQQLRFNSRMAFIVDQLLICFPSFFIWVGGLFFILFNRDGKKYTGIAIIYAVIIGLLLFFNGKGYYAAAIYPTIMAFGGVWISRVVERRKMRWLKWAAPVYMLIMTAFLLPVLLPFMSAEKLVSFYKNTRFNKHAPLKWEDKKQHPLPQDFADMRGWKEMAEKTARVYHSLPDSVKEKTMVYGENYGEAGALSFYRKQFNLPEIYSDNASFIFWLPDQFNKKYFLFVTDEMPEADDLFFTHWGKCEIKDSVTTKYAREFGTRIILYSNPGDSAKILAEQHTLRDKKQFNLR
ncbi:glycosyltransferase family 39 protein [Sediminibacterium roseum]|uniref:Glycosyltransferase family 39 protein n=1 Tax=Sediminibacterium roseum TaxID=1978412 RepID=A0ABW9ZPG3_9BACT|nr:glycosyltransferase family 39 protein [Sediminibacterium roseum]NCI48986.1 glycosyltransferase family 39 protein [Sediminibacterium roseum]